MAKNVLYKFSLEQKVALLNTKGIAGHAIFSIVIVDHNGKKLSEDDPNNYVEDPNELIS